mmetsp:Transcript_25004/g.28709  ORF Transcript_25004/g.28709 Transcript_25004/m.28709 type:complete len:95 (+) Transcript_25004:1852-2136(+)
MNSFCPSVKYEANPGKIGEEQRRDPMNSSNKACPKKREHQFRSLGRSGQKPRYNIGTISNFSNSSRKLPQLNQNNEKAVGKVVMPWAIKPENVK